MTQFVAPEPPLHASADPVDLPPALEPAEPETGVDLPHYTWGEEWRPILRHFGLASERMRPVGRVSYEPQSLPMRTWQAVRARVRGHKLHDYTATWHVPVGAVRDPGLRRQMLAFTDAFYDFELPPEDAIILTRMLDGPGEGTLHLFGFLHAALGEVAGHPAVAIAAPTGNTGTEDGGPFDPHSDMWIPALLFNVFHHVVPGQGASLLLAMSYLWLMCAAGAMPAEAIGEMREAVVEAGECDYYNHFNGWLYRDHPWTPAVRDALVAASIKVPMEAGQGYMTNDRAWLHGRTALAADALPPDLKEKRLYRIAYNNRRLQATAVQRKIDWASIGRTAKGC